MSEQELNQKKEAFHRAMLDLYQTIVDTSKKQAPKYGLRPYNPSYFRKLILSRGGYEAAKQLLSSKEAQAGFTELWCQKLIHLSMEALVLHKEWRDLFTEDELEVARSRLLAHGEDPAKFEV